TSNTLVVSEMSNFYVVGGVKVNWTHGNHCGWSFGPTATTSPPNYQVGGDNRTPNCVSIAYQINQKTGWATPANCQANGVCQNLGGQIPMMSAHSGGVVGTLT